MQVTSIDFQNYRAFSKLRLEFKSQFTVLVGKNGNGKTSVLRGLADALASVLSPQRSFTYKQTYEDGYSHIDVSESEGRFRFDQVFPVRITANASLGNFSFAWTTEKASPSALLIVDLPPWQQLHNLNPNLAWDEPRPPEPIVIFYRASRSWETQDNENVFTKSITAREDRGQALNMWNDASADASAFKAWVVSKCLERFQRSSETGRLFNYFTDDELALVNSALSQAIPQVKGLRFDFSRKSILVEWKKARRDGSFYSMFDNLSSGQREMIALLGDIARRLALMNPHLGTRVMLDSRGVVLIDELDLHLHPAWQRRIVKALRTAFPQLQFIVATHSPQIIGSLKPDEILILDQTNGEKPPVSHPSVSYGLDASSVIEAVMDTGSRPDEIQTTLDDINQLIDQNKLGSARRAIDSLKTLAPGIPEIVGLEALLKRKEAIGR